MSPKSQVEDIEIKLDALSQRYKTHEQSAEVSIKGDQDIVLDCLQKGIQSLQTTIESLKDDDGDVSLNPAKDQLAIALDYVSVETPKIPGAFITELKSPEPELSLTLNPKGALVRNERCSQMSACFTDLANSADKQLEDIMEIQLTATSMEDELDRLKTDLDQAAKNAQLLVKETHESLERQKNENESAQGKLRTVEVELKNLEEKANENKEQRKVVKVLKYGALAITPVFPIAGIAVAGASQIGHMVLQDKKQDLLTEKQTAESRTATLQTELESFERQIKSLESSLLNQKKLSSRCDCLTQQARKSKLDLCNKASEYQLMKEAAGNFVLWTVKLQSRAELMEDFDEAEEIRRGVRMLVDDLGKCDGEGVKRICGPLKALRWGEDGD